MRYYDYPSKEEEDVFVELADLEKVKYGEIFKGEIRIENRSNQVRTLKAVVSCNSIYYTGILANLVKKSQGEFELQPGQSKFEVIYYNYMLHNLFLYSPGILSSKFYLFSFLPM